VPERSDRAYALLAAVTAAVLSDNTAQRWTAGWEIISRAGERRKDVAAVAARMLAQHRPADAQLPTTIKLFAPLLRDAGLLVP
jgi:hypothetical protein